MPMYSVVYMCSVSRDNMCGWLCTINCMVHSIVDGVWSTLCLVLDMCWQYIVCLVVDCVRTHLSLICHVQYGMCSVLQLEHVHMICACMSLVQCLPTQRQQHNSHATYIVSNECQHHLKSFSNMEIMESFQQCCITAYTSRVTCVDEELAH